MKVETMEWMRFAQLASHHNSLLDYADAITGVQGGFGRMQIPPPPRFIQNGHTVFNNIHVENSTVGVINTGDVKNIDSVVGSAKKGGDAALATALKQFTEAVLQATELAQDQKNDVISQLAFLSQQAVAKDKQAASVLRSIATGIERSVNGVASLVTLWPILHAHLQPYLGF